MALAEGADGEAGRMGLRGGRIRGWCEQQLPLLPSADHVPGPVLRAVHGIIPFPRSAD